MNNFDKDFNKAKKMTIVLMTVIIISNIALLSGFIFILFKILQHFGIL